MMRKPEDLAETPNFGTDAFSEVLNIVHVRGETARLITAESARNFTVPGGTPCVYIVDQGRLEITVGSEPALTLHENQIALLLQGTAHEAAFSDPERSSPRAQTEGSGPARQEREAISCFWGSFAVDGEQATRILSSLPKVIVLDDFSQNPIEWVDTVCQLVLRELDATRPGGSLMVSRLLDLLLVIILRRWAQSEDSLPGWLAAAKDERIARTVSAIHRDSARTFTNGELADIAGMSKSSFTSRFKQVMGQSPGAYLRTWRLDQAAEALLHSSASIDALSFRVGYASKEAFSRAFQTRFHTSPSAWRASRSS